MYFYSAYSISPGRGNDMPIPKPPMFKKPSGVTTTQPQPSIEEQAQAKYMKMVRALELDDSIKPAANQQSMPTAKLKATTAKKAGIHQNTKLNIEYPVMDSTNTPDVVPGQSRVLNPRTVSKANPPIQAPVPSVATMQAATITKKSGILSKKTIQIQYPPVTKPPVQEAAMPIELNPKPTQPLIAMPSMTLGGTTVPMISTGNPSAPIKDSTMNTKQFEADVQEKRFLNAKLSKKSSSIPWFIMFLGMAGTVWYAVKKRGE